MVSGPGRQHAAEDKQKRKIVTNAQLQGSWKAEGLVDVATDILDQVVQDKILRWLRSGEVRVVHFGTPCTTYSRARRHDGRGPPADQD